MAEHARSSRLSRNLAFLPKEIRDAARQPRLIATLVLGPFLILFLFGLGYRPTPGPLEALLVATPESGFASQLPRLQEVLGDEVDLSLADSAASARGRLAEGSVDLVVIAPTDAAETVRGGNHAVIEVLHDTLDPFDRAYLMVLAQTSTSELNRIVLEEATRRLQEQTGEAGGPVPAARDTAGQLVEALERDDERAARAHQEVLALRLALMAGSIASSLDLVEGVEVGVGGEADDQVLGRLAEARETTEGIDPGAPTAVEEARAVEASLEELEVHLAELEQLEPSVLVQPFVSETSSLAPVEPDLESFYVPGVIAVLLQHIAVTFGALSLVRDRRLGIVEVFRVSPLSTGEMLVGKYLAYTLYGLVIAAALTGLGVLVLSVPMLGSWWVLSATIALTLLASIALGFLLSALAATDSQAVQYAMIVLLVTIFFSGFVISLDRLHPAATVVSYLVPATMGIHAMQDIMFRGSLTEPLPLVLLGAYFLLAALGSWWLLRRQMANGA